MKIDCVRQTNTFISLMGAMSHQFENSTVSSELVPHTDFSHF